MKTFVAALILTLAFNSEARNLRPRASFTRDGRIINGQPANSGEFPFIVAFYHLDGFHCGASIISDDWVLSAAHCTFAVSPSSVDLYAGSTERGEGQHRTVSEVIWNEEFNWIPADANDIGVMRLTEPFDSNDVSFPTSIVPLAESDTENPDPYAGQEGIIIGWGLNEDFRIPDNLQWADMDIITMDECKDHWFNQIVMGHVCVFDEVGDGQSSCDGDSGGPLVIGEPGNYLQVGLTSWGADGCDTSFPSVYTAVYYYRDWITEKTGV